MSDFTERAPALRRTRQDDPMHEYGLNSRQDFDAMDRSLAIIDILNDPDYRASITVPPAEGSEIARLEGAALRDPVDLSHSLSSAAIGAIDSLQEIAARVRQDDMILTPARSMMRTALMGAGRIGYVILPDTPEEREAHATNLLDLETSSLKKAVGKFETFEEFRDVLPEPDDLDDLKAQFALHPKQPAVRDGAMIEEAMRLIGREVAAHHPNEPVEVHGEELEFIWQTSSGGAHGFHWQNDFTTIFTADLLAVASGVHFTLDKLRRFWH